MAFEPFVRRRWPGRIISWSRLLAGGFRDPLVGRDILIGAVFGLGTIFGNFYLSNLVPQWLGYPPRIPWFDFPATQLLGIHSFVQGVAQQIFGALVQSFILLFFLLLLYIILRRERVAAFVVWLIIAVALSLTHETIVAVPFSCRLTPGNEYALSDAPSFATPSNTPPPPPLPAVPPDANTTTRASSSAGAESNTTSILSSLTTDHV